MPTGPRARRAEQLAAALDGEPTDARTAGLSLLAARVGALPIAVPPRQAAVRAATLAAFTAAAAEVAQHAAAPAAHAAAQSTAAQTAAHTAERTGAHTAGHTVAAHGLAAAVHSLLLPVVTGVAAVAVAAGAVGVAAHRSLPGDPFYGVKRATESVQVSLAGGGAAGARERLDVARTRLAEIRALAGRAPSATRTARIDDEVAALNTEIERATGPLLAAGPAATAELGAVVAGLRAGLLALPSDAVTPAVTRSVGLLGALMARVTPLSRPGDGSPAPVLPPATSPGPGTTPATPVTPTSPAPTGPATTPPGTVNPTGPAPTRPAPTKPPPPPRVSLPPILPSLPVPTGQPTVIPTTVPSLPVSVPAPSILGGLSGGGS